MRHARWVAVFLPSLMLGASLAACAHTEVAPVDPPDNPPLTGPWPRQLTFNTFDDRHPQWLPDGSAIIYSTEREDQLIDTSLPADVQGSRDRCIALLPADGGTQLWRTCETDGRHADTADVFEWPSVSPSGDAVFIHTTGWRLLKKTGTPRIERARGFDFAHAQVVRTLPFISSTGKQQVLGWTFRWRSEHELVYLGVLEFFQGSTFFPDTFFTGQEVMMLNLIDDSTSNLTVVPGTEWASSVAVGDDSTTIYYTLGGDTRVYRRDLNRGVVDTVHDFGPGRIARDVSVRGDLLAAVVGDSVIFSYEVAHDGMVQRDEGGSLAVVDLTTGIERTYTQSPIRLFRHPEISPDGTLLAVEVQPYAIPSLTVRSDFNADNHRADIWLFSLTEGPLGP